MTVTVDLGDRVREGHVVDEHWSPEWNNQSTKWVTVTFPGGGELTVRRKAVVTS